LVDFFPLLLPLFEGIPFPEFEDAVDIIVSSIVSPSQAQESREGWNHQCTAVAVCVIFCNSHDSGEENIFFSFELWKKIDFGQLSQKMSNKYSLEFALDTLPPHILIGELYQIKICIVHGPTKGIGKRYVSELYGVLLFLVIILMNLIALPHQFRFKLIMHRMGNMQEENW
jgi:hypothetical protein